MGLLSSRYVSMLTGELDSSSLLIVLAGPPHQWTGRADYGIDRYGLFGGYIER